MSGVMAKAEGGVSERRVWSDWLASLSSFQASKAAWSTPTHATLSLRPDTLIASDLRDAETVALSGHAKGFTCISRPARVGGAER